MMEASSTFKSEDEESKTGSSGLSYYRNPGTRPLVEKTIGQCLDGAIEKYASKTCIVSRHENIRLTFAELSARADRFSAGLRKLGMESGDRIGIWSPNNVDWVITMFASARGGFILVPVNSNYQSAEIEYCVRHVGIRAIVVLETFRNQNYVECIKNIKSRCPTLEHVIASTDKRLPDTRTFAEVESLASRDEVNAIAEEQDKISPLDPFCIQFTSGTTGRSKAAILAHRAMVNNAYQAIERGRLDTAEDTLCLNVPLFHVYGLIVVLNVLGGNKLVIEGASFNGRESLNAIVEEKCTVVYGTPTMWVDMIDARSKINPPISGIRLGVIGGSTISPELQKLIKEKLFVKKLGPIYGLTECTGTGFQGLLDDDDEILLTTVGYVSDHLEVQVLDVRLTNFTTHRVLGVFTEVVDRNGIRVPFGTRGELWMRGHNVMIGYWNDQEKTNEIITEDGWLKSGDQFVLRSNGYGEVVGRLKDIIIRGGENIYPREIEDFLLTHPDIMEAYVIGVRDDRMGEEACAYVRLQESSSLGQEDIREYCRDKIARFKVPRYVRITNIFPKTPVGKVQKHVLREWFDARKDI